MTLDSLHKTSTSFSVSSEKVEPTLSVAVAFYASYTQMSAYHNNKNNNIPYAVATPSAHTDSRREVGVPIAHGELRDPHYATTQKTDVKFATADVRNFLCFSLFVFDPIVFAKLNVSENSVFFLVQFAVNGNDVRSERRPPPYGDGSDALPTHLQRCHGAPADAKADDDGVPFVVRSKGPPFGVGEE